MYAVTPPQYLDDPEEHNDETFWRPEHGMAAFFDHVETQLQRNHDRFMPDSDPGPKEVGAPLFESYEMIKKLWLDVQLSEDTEWTVLVSKWRFPYRVRDDHHRRHLNLALDVGIGRRTPLGFLNKRKTPSITLCLVYGERTISIRSSTLLKPSVADRNGMLNIDVSRSAAA